MSNKTMSASLESVMTIDIPFLSSVGIKRTYMGEEGSELEVTLAPQHLNSFQIAHGGVLMTMHDVAMAMAGRAKDPQHRGVVTIEMKTSFMSPGYGRLVAKGKCLHRSRTMVFCESTIADEQGKIVSHATGTFKFIKDMPKPR